ncbi:MAG: cytochrome C [Acidobacteria bacterium]|nr:cytochrome C [Acidobacteriota bacterium]
MDRMLFIRALLRSLATGAFILILTATATAASEAEPTDIGCIGCHTTPGLNTRFPGGEVLSLAVDVEGLNASVHKTLHCTSCHSGIRMYPHPKMTASDYRAFQIENGKQCRVCHPNQFEQELDSIHARAMAAGNLNAAICVDCHGSHAIGRPNQPRHKISANCGKCHGVIYAQYITSVHGKALLEDSSPDVPVCTDCHTSHKQEDPTTQAFRLRSPKLCAKCHADVKLMRKYNISPDVFNTYVADFHGMTVTLFEKEHPDQKMNAAVCTDCHGIHDMQKVTDANSTVVKENLLNTCRRCHPGAASSFPDSWVGHFPPTRDRYPLVYYVNLFYRFLIPITIGAMVLFVIIDAGGKIVRRFRKGRA